jgi:hypothetical protein
VDTVTLTEKPVLQIAHWGLARRVAFRWCFVYFGLYCLLTQVVTSLFPIPKLDIPDPSTLSPVHQVVSWTAAQVFHVTTPLIYTGSGSGDKTFDWVLVFCLLILTAFATAVWSVLDRKRGNYIAMHKWFRLAMRFALAGQMMAYGWAKAVPLQMPFPYLNRLVEHYGDFSPMGVLWSSIGASPGYEIFVGCAEMLGGILLIFPRTAMFGALVCLADMTEVFMLNMTYDVPVKLLAFHLVLLSLFLLAPDFRRLANLFFLNRAAQPPNESQLFGTLRANRIALAAQILFGVWLIGMDAFGSSQSWYLYGGGAPKSPLYGIWDVEQLSIDGQVRPPLLTDRGRWRRAIFDFPTRMSFQRLDDSFVGYATAIKDRALTLTKASDKNWKASFAFERGGPDRLTLDGDMDGHKTRMELKLEDRNKFLLVSRGFHWIQEYPFNR